MSPSFGIQLQILLLLAGSGIGAPPKAGEQRRAAEVFLEKYGYLREHIPESSSSKQLTDALREFQWVSHLPITGLLDTATRRQMAQPRCGVDDSESHSAWTERLNSLFAGRRAKMRLKKRFVQQTGGKWYKRHLSYRLVNWPEYLPESAVRRAVKAAFQVWSNVSSLEFWEAPASGPADIRLTFFQGDHNDGLSNAFDGPGGALAHAFLPRRGEAHFDRDERWSFNSRRGRNLFVVLAHEIGHTLGLSHSPAPRALMAPYYKRLGRDSVLNWNDVLAIQSLYGQPLGGSVAQQLPGKLFTNFENWDPHKPWDRKPGTRGPYYCHSFFDTITADKDHRVYIFKGNSFWEVGVDGNVSEPQLLQEKWAGLPPNIEAAAVSHNDGDFYFFKGSQVGLISMKTPNKQEEKNCAIRGLEFKTLYNFGQVTCRGNTSPSFRFKAELGSRCWRFRGSRLLEGYPQLCRAGGLPRHPDTAFFFPPLHRIVLFKGPRYYVLTDGGLQIEPYYPRGLRDWGGVPSGIQGALPGPKDSILFFRDDRYWRFDQISLKVVATGQWAEELPWMGCWDANSGGALF